MMPSRQNAISIGTSAAFHIALLLSLLAVTSIRFVQVATQQGRSSIQLVAQLASAQPSASKSEPELQIDFEPAPPEKRPPEPEVAPAVDILQRRPPAMVTASVQRQLPPLPNQPPVDQETSATQSPARLTQQPRTKSVPPQPLARQEANEELIQALITVSAPMAIASNGAQVDELPREAPLNPAPQYPAASLAARHQGRVMLRVRTTAEGAVARVEIAASSGYALLDEAARTAVLSWRFLPARRNGEAVAFEFQMPIRFRIRS